MMSSFWSLSNELIVYLQKERPLTTHYMTEIHKNHETKQILYVCIVCILTAVHGVTIGRSKKVLAMRIIIVS